MIRAIQIEQPDYQLQETDIVACGSTMGDLLRFILGSDKAFRILVEAVGNTVFFLRRENSPFETIPDVHGYGHSFPEAYTAWSSEVRGSESHQRILGYEFAGMKVLVRFEGDGFLPECVQDDGDRPNDIPYSSRSGSGSGFTPEGSSTEKELLESMANAAVSAVHPTSTTESAEALKIEKRGRSIPQSAVFGLKTRSIEKKDVDTLDEALPRLWVAQTPNFMLARHESGLFSSVDIDIKDTRDAIKEWEEEHQETLLAFAALLKRLVAIARSSGKFEIVREIDSRRGMPPHWARASPLVLREQGGSVRGVLPADLMKKWDVGI